MLNSDDSNVERFNAENLSVFDLVDLMFAYGARCYFEQQDSVAGAEMEKEEEELEDGQIVDGEIVG